MAKNLVFDLDGTLTDHRSEMELDFRSLFLKAIDMGYSISIATGSDIDYVKDQCSKVIDLDITYYCCNSSKIYKLKNKKIVLVEEKNMKKFIGDKSFEKLISLIKRKQKLFELEYKNISEEIIQERSAMVNWCPIGRKSDNKYRKYFVSFDKRELFRDKTVSTVGQLFRFDKDLSKLIIKKGGQTSFDIYPKGWDKSQIFKYIEKNDMYFWGDKCSPSGNDWEIYSFLHEDRRYSVSSPKETFDTLKELLEK